MISTCTNEMISNDSFYLSLSFDFELLLSSSFLADSKLAIALKAPCSVFATCFPAEFSSPAEVTSASLVNSDFAEFPESLGNLPCHLASWPEGPCYRLLFFITF